MHSIEFMNRNYSMRFYNNHPSEQQPHFIYQSNQIKLIKHSMVVARQTLSINILLHHGHIGL